MLLCEFLVEPAGDLALAGVEVDADGDHALAAPEELARVRRKTLNVSTLSFCIQCVEGKRRFAAA